MYPKIIIFLLLITSLYLVANDDFDKGMEAFNKSQYTAAITHLEKAAEQGHANAQSNLGLMYASGGGVTKDK